MKMKVMKIMNNPNLLYQIAFTLVKGIGNITGRQLLEKTDNIASLFNEEGSALERSFGLSKKIVSEIQRPEVLQRAEKELVFIEKNNIKPYFITDDNYPHRLKECVDAPLLLYYKGNADLNARKIISIVGTRDATTYGKSIIEELMAGIKTAFPDTLIASGLAYGIDIAAHKSALDEGLSTVAVLAHGLDRIYPPPHRKTAVEMVRNGGLISEYISETKPDKPNFIKRNRIVAGMADCTLVIESAEKGGALITANIADSYNRDVFAFPGKTTDKYSQGCNSLIKYRKASLVTCADDIFREMNWKSSNAKEPLQRSLFIKLTDDEQRIVDVLSGHPAVQLNTLCVELDFPMSKLAPLLFDLEMNGVLKSLPGGLYQLT